MVPVLMKSNIGFMVEEEIWEDDEARILSVLTDWDIPFVLHPLRDFDSSISAKLDVDQIFCYGSLQWIAQVQAANDPRLRVICSIDNFDCQKYYPHFSQYLFNWTHTIISLRYFVDHFDMIVKNYGGKVFMRPCTGFKSGSISGGVFDRWAFDEYIEFFTEALEDDAILVVDWVKPIDFEWRTIIDGKKCITGCQYKSRDEATGLLGIDPSSDFPERVKAMAERVVVSVSWSPDDLYVLDIVESEGKLFVMEINALSTSGWYDCDVGAIVDSIVRYFNWT